MSIDSADKVARVVYWSIGSLGWLMIVVILIADVLGWNSHGWDE